MDNDFLKPYDHAQEKEIYAQWEQSGYFNPDKRQGIRQEAEGIRENNAQSPMPESFTVMIAPPNITGSLHMGHALENTISDILVRYHRMKGFRTLWVPGTDHAGIATQNVVEKDLKKQGITRHDLGREKFIEKIWEWKETYGNIILDQLRSLGCSLDWSRTRFTMDEGYQEAVKEAFARYKEKGLIYQGERVINWCIKDQTALSDLELEYVEEVSKLWHIKYPLEDGSGYITVATTRPETMLGDTALAVHPKDERYITMIGKKAIVPIVDREILIIADESIDKEFGTGAVKVTPAHDMADADMGERHALPVLKVIDERGKIMHVGEEFDGLSLSQAREKVIEKLTVLGLLEKEEDLTHNVAKCYRCNSTVEPMLSKQWFLKMQPLAEAALKAIRGGEVRYYPERWKDIAVAWLEQVRDWCISRQIWWGHRIPIEGSEDTFDTWFSSALWPFATLGWPKETNDLKTFYPTAFMTSARDILHLWISRMIFSGLEFTAAVPFKDVFIHATILTKEGKRMSKSLGTGIDPLTLIEKYGADAVRFGLIWQSMGGQDIRWAEEHVQAGKKFANKLWNITRFVLTKDADLRGLNADVSGITDTESVGLLKKLMETKKSVEEQIAAYDFGQALHTLYDFIWRDFADVYIEYSKDKNSEEIKNVLSRVLMDILKMLHPFMPFVTESIYQRFPTRHSDFLMVEKW